MEYALDPMKQQRKVVVCFLVLYGLLYQYNKNVYKYLEVTGHRYKAIEMTCSMSSHILLLFF